MVGARVKPFVNKKLFTLFQIIMAAETTQMTLIKCFHTLESGLITCTQVDINGFEWLLKVTIHTCDLSACNLIV